MSDTKHTPGPWKAGINYVPYEYDYCYVEIPGLKKPLCLSPALKHEANARLIAASPALLEACKAFIADWDNHAFDVLKDIDCFGMIFAAIAQCEVKR